MITLGIDLGSTTSKAVVITEGVLCAYCILPAGYDVEKTANTLVEKILDKAGINLCQVDKIVATGYGRERVLWADKAITEISCHAVGAHYLNPNVLSVIDIGGQDSKVIVLNSKGEVTNFAMNDKCAAGTGRFIEVMARTIELDVKAFSEISISSKNPASISSLCAVFAESEVINLISKGENRENIVAGIYEAISARIAGMVRHLNIQSPVMMTGGVAQNAGLVQVLEKKIDKPIEVNELSQVCGAIGAAKIASDLMKR